MNYPFKTKPYIHQLVALDLSWDKIEYAYFMEMGTGKSKVLLDNAAMLFDAGLQKKFLPTCRSTYPFVLVSGLVD